MVEPPAHQRVPRGRFLRLLGTAGTALVGLSIAATPRYLVALASGTRTLKKAADLKALKVGVNGPFTFGVEAAKPNTHAIYLIKDAQGTVRALEATCRHRGCPVNWVAADKKFECPCHGSQYAPSGKVVHCPAQANLYSHTVVVKAGQVWVMTGRSST